METVVIAIAALACPLGMGLCMWLMARGMRSSQADKSAGTQVSVTDLRREQERISAQIEELEQNGEPTPDLARR